SKNILYKQMKHFLSTILFLATIFTASAQINTDQVLRSGRSALYFEDYVLSIQYFNQAIAAKPYLAQPYFYRALAKLNLDDFNGALTDASEAISRNPFMTDAYELRAVAYQNLGQPEKAIADYDQVLKTLPDNRGIIFNKALAQQDIKDYEGAKKAYDTLLKAHPRFDNGYIGRARLKLETGDTLGAYEDAQKALEINKNAINAYLLKADVEINKNKDYAAALSDMDEAIKIQPRYPGFFINRAFIRRNLDDYYGAISDYDYAIQLAPGDYVPFFNRALLYMEVRDFDRALKDLDKVIALHGPDIKTLYNRAIVRNEKRDFKGAMADINEVLRRYPNLAAGYFLRSQVKRDMGDQTFKADYDKSIAMAKETVQKTPDELIVPAQATGKSSDLMEDTELAVADNEQQEEVAARFTSLITVNEPLTLEQEFNNKQIRGKVQDRIARADIEPMFAVTYYSSPTELRPNSEYIREADDINRSRILRFVLQVTNHEPILDDAEQIQRHFESVEYYNSYLATHTPRAIDYFARGMDFMTLRDYPAAVADFSKAIEVTPDFTLAYMMRAIARLRGLQASSAMDSHSKDAGKISAETERMTKKSALADIDKTIALSPDMAIAHYNKGVLMLENSDYTSAINAFTKAIELRPELGEAYYNRGFAFFRLGNARAGTADLSRAGELGVVPSYSLLKRMSR
ncbi:MAG: tetratricopeptide repeat protein, partial [Paramuribaculum sp.]|nr:tetratricopeptide repeat protein [Paramuribaculum sp.]